MKLLLKLLVYRASSVVRGVLVTTIDTFDRFTLGLARAVACEMFVRTFYASGRVPTIIFSVSILFAMHALRDGHRDMWGFDCHRRVE